MAKNKETMQFDGFSLTKRKQRGNIYYVKFHHTPEKWVSSGCTDKEQAIAWAFKFLDSPQQEEKTPKLSTLQDFTLGFFAQDTHRFYARQRARNKTFNPQHPKQCEGMLKNYILPMFGSRSMQSLKPREIEDFLLDIDGVADNTKNKILNVFRIVLDEAVAQELIPSNPARAVPPVIENNQEREPFTLLELAQIFPQDRKLAAKIWPHPTWELYFRVMLAGGLRPGEVGALRWSDFLVLVEGLPNNEPSQQGLLSVLPWPEYKRMNNSSLIPHFGALAVNKSIESETKEDKGLKTEKKGLQSKPVILTPKTFEFLAQFYEQAECNDSDHIFTIPSERGKSQRTIGIVLESGQEKGVIHATISNKIFKNAVERAGVQRRNRTQYCLRHTFQTLMVNLLDKDDLTERMGHTEYLESYTHQKLVERIAYQGNKYKERDSNPFAGIAL